MNPRYHVIFQPEPEGGFTAIVPSLPGCVTYGRTIDEARAFVKDAIQGYIESLKAHNEPVPSDEALLVADIQM